MNRVAVPKVLPVSSAPYQIKGCRENGQDFSGYPIAEQKVGKATLTHFELLDWEEAGSERECGVSK